jgi:hypothetical protein
MRCGPLTEAGWARLRPETGGPAVSALSGGSATTSHPFRLCCAGKCKAFTKLRQNSLCCGLSWRRCAGSCCCCGRLQQAKPDLWAKCSVRSPAGGAQTGDFHHLKNVAKKVSGPILLETSRGLSCIAQLREINHDGPSRQEQYVWAWQLAGHSWNDDFLTYGCSQVLTGQNKQRPAHKAINVSLRSQTTCTTKKPFETSRNALDFL